MYINIMALIHDIIVCLWSQFNFLTIALQVPAMYGYGYARVLLASVEYMSLQSTTSTSHHNLHLLTNLAALLGHLYF